jgi:hypothetical protein
MAKDFSALRSNSARAVTRPCLWAKETSVVRRERHHPQQRREIQSTFEPSRLSLAWLAQAYEQVVPMIRRTTSRSLPPHGEDAEELRRYAPHGSSPFIGESQAEG